MSLGDYLRLLRARHGGITPVEIEAATGLTPGLYRQMEQRYRAMGDDEAIRSLAQFYGVPYQELRWRHDWPRKALNHDLRAAMIAETPITLQLWNGATASGLVKWWDLGAVGLEGADGALVVVQRHAVERWEPRSGFPPGDAVEESAK